MNPLEDNFRLYKVVGGKRTPARHRSKSFLVKAGTWHTITVRMKGDKIECHLDGKKHLTATD